MQGDAKIISFRASDGNTVRLEYRQSLPSTVALAKEYALVGYPDRYAVFSEKQTAFTSLGEPLSGNDSEGGLYLSCILRPSIFPSQAGCIGPISAAALADAMEEHTMKKVGVGWISDIYCDGIRSGTTAVEGKLDNFTSYEYLIVSFAVKIDAKKFTPRLTDRVRRIFEDDNESIAMIIAKTVLNKFFLAYREIKTPQKHINHYVSKFALVDKKVKYIDNGKKKSAKVVGINKENMALIIEMRDGTNKNVTSRSSVILPNKI